MSVVSLAGEVAPSRGGFDPEATSLNLSADVLVAIERQKRELDTLQRAGHVGRGLDSDIRTRVTPLEDLKLPAREGQDCLVIIYSSDARQFGRRYLLTAETVSFGRDSENVVVLENDAVSRKHAVIEKRSLDYYVQDLESTNGTFVNDALVRDYQLRRGDQIKIGDTIMKFLSGSDMEAQYHETIYKMTIVDGLSGVNNKRFFLDAMDREIPRARRHQRPLSLVMMDLDHFKGINDTFGHLAGDFVLKEFAQLVKARLRPDDILARYGGEEFAVILPETDREDAHKIADGLRAVVADHRFEFEGEHVRVTVSCGVAQLADGWDVLHFVKAADDRLYMAKRGGRDCVRSASPAGEGSGGHLRRTLDGPILIQRALTRGTAYALVAFELRDERTVLAELGAKVRESWLRDLETTLDETLPSTNLVGRYESRYLLAAVEERDASSLGERIEERWRTMGGESASEKVPRLLRHAVLGWSDMSTLRERALDQLIVRLLEPPPTDASTSHDRLPFPLAGPRFVAQTATTSFLKLKSAVHGLEVAVRFAVALGLGLIREAEDSDAHQALARFITDRGARPMPMGAWLVLLQHVVNLVPPDSVHPAAAWLRVFAKGRTARPSSLTKRMIEAVEERNVLLGHGAPLPDDSYREPAERLSKLLDDVLAQSEPLAATRLVSVHSSEVLGDEDGGIAYELRSHVGSHERFAISRQVLDTSLGRPWCYVLAEGHPPLSLSPVFLCTTCKECRRVEVFVADRIVLGPQGAEVTAFGVTTDHATTAAIQWSRAARRLAESGSAPDSA